MTSRSVSRESKTTRKTGSDSLELEGSYYENLRTFFYVSLCFLRLIQQKFYKKILEINHCSIIHDKS